MADILFLDWETFSTIPIRHGTYKYMEKVEGLLLTYALNDGPIKLWELNSRPDLIPTDLCEYFLDDDLIVCAHESRFDRLATRHILDVDIPIRRWVDTKVIAYRHSLPGHLAELCEIFRIPKERAKLKDGKDLINLFCKPLAKNRKLRRASKYTHPAEWERFKQYAINDVESMRIIYNKIPKWNNTEKEKKYWGYDQKSNDRGFAMDIPLIHKIIEILNKTKQSNNKRVSDITLNEVGAATQRDKFLKFILTAYGMYLPDLTASTVSSLLRDDNLDSIVRELLELRQESSKTSTRKYTRMLEALSSDRLMRGTITYGGAWRTLRYSSSIVQFHNMPRPKHTQDIIDSAIELIQHDCLDMFHDDINNICASLIRSMIVPRKGKKLVVADFASIESRILAWLAGEEWKLQTYIDYDKGLLKYDVYETTYSTMFDIPSEMVSSYERKLGKVVDLAFGYAGGVGAIVAFCVSYNIDIDSVVTSTELPAWAIQKAQNYYNYCLEEHPYRIGDLTEKQFVALDGLKRVWRAKHPAITQLWHDMGDSIKYTIKTGKSSVVNGLYIDKKGTWLRIRLPSGRYLSYPSIRIEKGDITYLGKHPTTYKITRLKSHGGKFVENIDQSIARDFLCHALVNAEDAGYNVLFHAHDEPVTEAPDTPEYNAKELERIISQRPDWAKDFPLAAEGFESYRYRKG